MLNLSLTTVQQKRKWSTNHHITQQNGFPPKVIHKLRHQIEHKTKHPTPHDSKNKKWATFTYISLLIRKVTNIFRNTNIRIVYKCRNTIAKLIKPPKDQHKPPHSKWGIYQLTCNKCNLSYVGQTSRSLSIHIRQHVRYIRYNNSQSTYTLHILQNQHEYGQMNRTMTLFKPLNNPSISYVYGTVHHLDSWVKRNQLDATYFIIYSILIQCSTCFGR